MFSQLCHGLHYTFKEAISNIYQMMIKKYKILVTKTTLTLHYKKLSDYKF